MVAAYSFAEASLRNAEVVKAMAMLDGIQRRWIDRHGSGLAQQAKASDRAGTLMACSKATRVFLQVAILGAGAMLAIHQVITPGVTTTDDVVWWMRQRVAEMGLGSWFHPSVSIQRQGGSVPASRVIERGDMLHTDFGIVYLGFSTDTQHNAYVLKPGETEAPAGLRAGLAAANRLQDLTMQHATLGGTGNAALAGALAAARAEGLLPSIYCHPVGYHGHAAGPPIGMTDYQQGVPVRGEYIFRPDTWHSIELNVRHKVAEWGGQEVRFALEEDAVRLSGGWEWIDGRQTAFYLIR